MKRTPYKKGRDLEEYIARKLRKEGLYVVRSAGSKGVFDLIVFRPIISKFGKRLDIRNNAYGIQIKEKGNFSDEDFERMAEYRKKYGIRPIIAYKEGNRIVMKHIGNLKDFEFWKDGREKT